MSSGEVLKKAEMADNETKSILHNYKSGREDQPLHSISLSINRL